jgi:signal recognition particle receptor subunit beta
VSYEALLPHYSEGSTDTWSLISRELPNILTRLASTSLTSSHLPAPKLLILAHKADLLLRTISNPNPKPTPLDDKTKKMALERAKTVITREMERLKSARGTTGGKIEGIDAVPSSSSSGLLSRFFGTSSSSGEKPTVISEQGMEEAELMLWGQSGRFSWDEIEGVDVDWAVSGLGNASDAVEDGLEELKDWLSEL